MLEKKTLYAVTNCRLLVLTDLIRFKSVTISLSELHNIYVLNFPKKVGTVFLNKEGFEIYNWTRGFYLRGITYVDCLDLIENANEVSVLIEKARMSFNKADSALNQSN